MNNRPGVSLLCVAVSAAATALLAISLMLPLWKLRMEAPQYREEEALKVAVFPGALRGDLNEITVLNQYIGVHIPSHLPQLQWLPAALLSAAGVGLGASFLPRRLRTWSLAGTALLLTAALGAAALQAQWQMYDIGHKRDAKTKLVGIKDFTPPFFGSTKIAQFQVTSRLGLGAYLVGAAIALQLGAAYLSRERRRAARRSSKSDDLQASATWSASCASVRGCATVQERR